MIGANKLPDDPSEQIPNDLPRLLVDDIGVQVAEIRPEWPSMAAIIDFRTVRSPRHGDSNWTIGQTSRSCSGDGSPLSSAMRAASGGATVAPSSVHVKTWSTALRGWLRSLGSWRTTSIGSRRSIAEE
jgi:hypothetical protein